MDVTRRLQIELPESLALWIEGQVAAGRFVDASDAVGCALMALREQDEDAADDPETEAWLRDVVVPRLRTLDEGTAKTRTVDEVRASLARRRAAHDEAA